MALAVPKYQKWGALSTLQRNRLYAVLEFDHVTREPNTFKEDDVLETPYGLHRVIRYYHRGNGYVDGVWVSGYRYVCVPEFWVPPAVQSHSIYAQPPVRHFRQDELEAWNPGGALREVHAVADIVVVRPQVRTPLLVGNTMATPLLPAWSGDVRVIARHVVDFL